MVDRACRGCDVPAELNDLGLCDSCSAKLDRDMIRQREWEFSVSAFGVPRSKREALRQEVIAEHGPELELIAEDPVGRPGKKSRGGRKKKKRKTKSQSKR